MSSEDGKLLLKFSAWTQDDPECEIRGDVEGASFDIDNPSPCKHRKNDRVENYTESSGTVSKIRRWIVPWAIAATNEGGYAGTLVCLDCILEAVQQLKSTTLNESIH